MKTVYNLLLAGAVLSLQSIQAQEITLETAPPVVIRTVPESGSSNVTPALKEIRVTFSKAMQDRNWSWVKWSEESFPTMSGEPRYLTDQQTCVLPVRLDTNRFYALWINSERFTNFKDISGRPAVPYLLTFTTAPTAAAILRSSLDTAALSERDARLNEDQRAVLAWTERQFRSYFDRRTFEGLAEGERVTLETRLLEQLKGPKNREYYQAINTLGALRSPKGFEALRQIAFDRADKDNRDRWMSVRALGLAGDTASIPDMIHLVYHGNLNTRWWAQISLVRLTGTNFSGDWNAWGEWWNSTGGQPAYRPEIIRWWDGQAEPEKLSESLAESDRKFLDGLKSRESSH